jgi:hypothetical protein
LYSHQSHAEFFLSFGVISSSKLLTRKKILWGPKIVQKFLFFKSRRKKNVINPREREKGVQRKIPLASRSNNTATFRLGKKNKKV